MKAADLDDGEVVAAVQRIRERNRFVWAFTGEVAQEFPTAPFKVVAAKLSKLKKKGLLLGCACGCRGDWEPSATGLVLIGKAERTET